MSPASRHTSVRSIRRSVRRSALKEYVDCALWVLPSPAAEPFEVAVYADVRVGFERTMEQSQAAVEALGDAEHSIPRPPSLKRVRAAVRALRTKINSKATAAVEQA
jgi:hypothetical protein